MPGRAMCGWKKNVKDAAINGITGAADHERRSGRRADDQVPQDAARSAVVPAEIWRATVTTRPAPLAIRPARLDALLSCWPVSTVR